LKENVAAANARSLSDQEVKALSYFTKHSVYETHRLNQ
ncbi:aldo/keto reductase, partial [Bacillus altitudinis]|nr:aldo/keto reductase [Bacillus altitudinis]